MDLYFETWNKFATFSGRATRAEYWTFSLINNAIAIILSIIGILMGGSLKEGLMLFIILFSFFSFIASVSLSVRRLHDINLSGWWGWLFIPFGWPMFIVGFIGSKEKKQVKNIPSPQNSTSNFKSENVYKSTQSTEYNETSNDDALYEYVLEEIEKNDLQKGLWAKALALSEGNNDKAKSLYMQYRVQALKNELSQFHIDFSGLSKEKLWSILQDGLTQEEKITLEKEQDEKIELIRHKEKKQDQEKYGKIRGWLLFFAIILVIGDLSYLEIFKLFTSEHKEAMQELLIKAPLIFSYMTTTNYWLLAGLFFNTLFTISFFAKSSDTIVIAIVFFIFNILFSITAAYLIFDLQKNVAPEIFNATYSSPEMIKVRLRAFGVLIMSLIWIFYFIYSKRVKKTFTEEPEDFPTIVFFSILIPIVLFFGYNSEIDAIQNNLPGAQTQKEQTISAMAQLEKDCDNGIIRACNDLGRSPRGWSNKLTFYLFNSLN